MARRFRFPLETLLKVRRLREREAKRKVAAQRAALARLDQLDEATRAEIASRQQVLLGVQRQVQLEPQELTRGWAWIGHLRRTIVQRQVQREEMLGVLEKLQEVYREARRQTRVIEKLRERRWQQYVHDRERREQAAADELAQQLHSMQPATDLLSAGQLSDG
ncbi:MAG: flagellar FliJ family protein [Phycisphaerae bacterium]